MVGATTGGAGMMAELSPVPLGPRQSCHSDRQHRTVPMASEAGFRFWPLLALPEMEAATGDSASYNNGRTNATRESSTLCGTMPSLQCCLCRG